MNKNYIRTFKDYRREEQDSLSGTRTLGLGFALLIILFFAIKVSI